MYVKCSFFLIFQQKFEKRAENDFEHPGDTGENFVCGSDVKIFKKIDMIVRVQPSFEIFATNTSRDNLPEIGNFVVKGGGG